MRRGKYAYWSIPDFVKQITDCPVEKLQHHSFSRVDKSESQDSRQNDIQLCPLSVKSGALATESRLELRVSNAVSEGVSMNDGLLLLLFSRQSPSEDNGNRAESMLVYVCPKERLLSGVRVPVQ